MTEPLAFKAAQSIRNEVIRLKNEHVRKLYRSWEWVEQGLYPGTAYLDPQAQEKTSSWRASTHHRVQQGRQRAGHLAKSQARRLPEVHPEYSATASGRGSNLKTRYPLSAALTLQQCLFGDTKERYHQPIYRSGLTPVSRLQRSVGQRYSQDTIYLLTGRRTRQTCGLKNQRC
ncbi:hypothetical protein TNCV_4393151 [Trichonephila clavipes]|nr:hypothetical protein TNCV_4393151 [Trichonephila clavipes]